MKIVTHSQSFHSDEIFAVAALRMLYKDKKVDIIRSRDKEVIAEGDIVVDVGAVYEPRTGRFDHHQGGIPPRENGIPYASFGLVWKEFGTELCGSEEIAEEIDRLLVQPIDARDNGIQISEPLFKDVMPYAIQEYISSWKPTWKEDVDELDGRFMRMVGFAEEIIEREIKVLEDEREGIRKVGEVYDAASDKRIIVLDRYLSWKKVLAERPEPLFVVYPSIDGDSFRAQAVRSDLSNYENRKDFPKAWGGLRDEALQKVTGVHDALFCHAGLHLAAATSKEGALKLVELALAS